jgi:hypothetical protein
VVRDHRAHRYDGVLVRCRRQYATVRDHPDAAGPRVRHRDPEGTPHGAAERKPSLVPFLVTHGRCVVASGTTAFQAGLPQGLAVGAQAALAIQDPLTMAGFIARASD